MRQVLILCGFILLILSACEDNEKAIVPGIPQASGPDSPADTAGFQNGRPNLDFESELYQYGRFRNMPYRILVPRHYDPANRYPLHIFLHGVADRGTDNEQQLNVGASQFQVDSVREKYPAFIVFPQCPESVYWFDTAVMHTLKRLIDSVVSANAIDTAEISIGGYSMGAYGTFAMVAANPGFFEAGVAISGDGDERKAPSMAITRWQIFAGKNDRVVPSNRSRKMAAALEQAGASVSFTVFPDANHYNTWIKAFSKPDLFSWLFSHRQAAGQTF